jgi:PLP dependent protein
MADIAANILTIKRSLPSSVRLVAVSKTRPVSDILEAYNTGHRLFGENRVQELLNKKDNLPQDIDWHLIGHLQTNKVKLIVPFVSMIQSVDSYRLLAAVNSEAQKIDRIVNVLLQMHIAQEETKFGFSKNEIEEMIVSPGFWDMKFVRICGVMGMATFTDNTEQVRREFNSLAGNFSELKNKYFPHDEHFHEISMGMSGDYEIAVKEGSTIIRVGSLLFGSRAKPGI